MSVPEDRIGALLEKGIDIPEDPADIERLLADMDIETEEPPPDKPGDAKPPEKPKDEKPEAAPEAPPEAPPDEAKKPTEPPAAVLRATRESLHQTTEQLKARDEQLASQNARIEQLEGRIALLTSKQDETRASLQEVVDEATGGDVQLEELTPERIAEIREESGDEVADVLQKSVKSFAALQQRIDALEQSNQQLAQERDAVETASLQNDIDATPLLAYLQADQTEAGNERWQRAVAYEKAVKSDPDFQGASRRDVFKEVERRMSTHLGAVKVKELLGDKAPPAKPADKSTQTKVDEALRRADDRAVPTSLSDLPPGQAPAGSELERAAGMSLTDAEDAIARAFDKGGTAAVDELMAKLLTAEDTG